LAVLPRPLLSASSTFVWLVKSGTIWVSEYFEWATKGRKERPERKARNRCHPPRHAACHEIGNCVVHVGGRRQGGCCNPPPRSPAPSHGQGCRHCTQHHRRFRQCCFEGGKESTGVSDGSSSADQVNSGSGAFTEILVTRNPSKFRTENVADLFTRVFRPALFKSRQSMLWISAWQETGSRNLFPFRRRPRSAYSSSTAPWTGSHDGDAISGWFKSEAGQYWTWAPPIYLVYRELHQAEFGSPRRN
jgi:hypothetical protein